MGANPVESAALRPPGGGMRHESRDTPATGRHAASSQSGVWGAGVPSSIGGDDAKVPRKGSIEQVSRSVFAARGSLASGAGGVS